MPFFIFIMEVEKLFGGTIFMKTYLMNRYEYPITENHITYVGSYTIKADKKPLGFNGEVLVQTFEHKYEPHND